MKNSLNILWTNANPITAELMVFMYAEASVTRGWWDEVQIIVWGATAKLVAENKVIQTRLKEIQSSGVIVNACIACATELGVVEELSALGITLMPMGQPLTDILKNNERLLTV
ncbi:DsrE family protein [Oceanispirochaeta crateris]|uniref:DsrE family protein n=1 Tax=Oceanispirochaeta crateris TaxID=2518645 RepID=A0A5C1QMW6_9SPIO|nr:DsrE family protein [Oceanispirochaeta crateris]QEN08300.1 DsrE family protein [Oceanispirochaeta crateris]